MYMEITYAVDIHNLADAIDTNVNCKELKHNLKHMVNHTGKIKRGYMGYGRECAQGVLTTMQNRMNDLQRMA